MSAGTPGDRLANFGFLLKDLSERYVRRFEERALAISLTLSQCKTLVYLEKNQSLSQARLAELVNVQPMTMVRILDHMEADGLLERRLDPEDRRARCLYLTAAAKPVLSKIWRLAEQTRAEIFAGISAKDIDTFMNVLERVHGNASDLLPLAETAKEAPRAKPVPSNKSTSKQK
ncbi:MAG TPA: MarR family transcriptional regulator [Burkholderiales bacterium]